MEVTYWILKSEPHVYSIDDLKKDKSTHWDGIRNYQARNNLRKMKKGDKAVIYHSGDERAAVGLAEILKTAYPDPSTTEDWSLVDIKYIETFKKPLSLSEMKADAELKAMELVRQSRLSVCPLTEKQFQKILKLSR